MLRSLSRLYPEAVLYGEPDADDDDCAGNYTNAFMRRGKLRPYEDRNRGNSDERGAGNRTQRIPCSRKRAEKQLAIVQDER